MGKSTLVLIALAALGIGSLIGVSLVGDPEESRAAGAATAPPVSGEGGAPVFRYLDTAGVSVGYDEFGKPLPVLVGDNFVARDRAPTRQTLNVTLARDAMVEYKALMQQGDVIGFSWKTDGSDVYYDFHGHDASGGSDFFTRYDEGEGAARSGSIMAPYSGQHGWLWLNLGDGPTTITLEVYGFFDDVIEIDLEGY